ncbi:hypothetical protein Cgig2_025274 [Carnegiea gigantea]|uniref:Uncharacterized protein n=1 Tax=Carnegiea gigantea TaxID=171969 RepID=A0A9Q1KAU4_9CARY|nr:hypothetical protein Cgig2_025274 [Carnegiea gigantea]
MDPLLDWGIEHSLLAAMIRVHLTEEALEELGQDKGNKSFKKGEFAQASGLYKHAVKLLCFSCIVTAADDDIFTSLVITLNLNLDAPELKQGQFDNVMTLCSWILDFEPCNTKALFRRAKAASGLYNIWQAFCDLRKANRIDPNNIEIVEELQKIERIHSQGDEKRMEVHS